MKQNFEIEWSKNKSEAIAKQEHKQERKHDAKKNVNRHANKNANYKTKHELENHTQQVQPKNKKKNHPGFLLDCC